MSNPSPPSSRKYLVRVPGVIEAGGVLREMVGSLRNLDQLVRSMRVGPKGLERAISDVHSACEPCTEAVRSLAALLAEALPNSPPLAALSRFAEQRMAEMSEALETASHLPMTAKHRLALEQVLARVLPQLEASRDLLELLADAAWGPAMASPLLDVLSMSPPPRAVSGPGVAVKLDESLSHFEVELSPRLLLACLSILASAHFRRHGSGPMLQCRPQGSGYCLELNASDRPAVVVTWPLQPLVEPSLETVAAALRARGCEVVLGDYPRIVLEPELLRVSKAD